MNQIKQNLEEDSPIEKVAVEMKEEENAISFELEDVDSE
jgi:hypothetical protein